MFFRILVLMWVCTGIAAAQDAPLCTVSGSTADSLLSALPRDSTTWAQLGVLYANKVFLRETTNGQQDADSAVRYLERALQSNSTPRLQAYHAVARALRAKHDDIFTKAFGGTKDRVKQAFRDAERIARDYPHDWGVTFLVANLLQEGDPLEDAERYWRKSWDLFATLAVLAEVAPDSLGFFTPDVRANILLNQGKLIRKLVDEDALAAYLAREKWEAIIHLYPETLSADNAREHIKKL